MRYKETLDLAVIVPEIARAFAPRLAVGVLLPESARAVAPRYAFRRWPAFVMLADGRYVGAVDGLRNWDEYLDRSGCVARTRARASANDRHPGAQRRSGDQPPSRTDPNWRNDEGVSASRTRRGPRFASRRRGAAAVSRHAARHGHVSDATRTRACRCARPRHGARCARPLHRATRAMESRRRRRWSAPRLCRNAGARAHRDEPGAGGGRGLDTDRRAGEVPDPGERVHRNLAHRRARPRRLRGDR